MRIKKYLTILIVIASLVTSYFLYQNYNYELYIRYLNFADYVSMIEDKDKLVFLIDIENNNQKFMTNFITQLNETANHHYSFVIKYNVYENEMDYHSYALFTQNEDVLNELNFRSSKNISFDSLSNKEYYTTELNDPKANGYIQILNNKVFENCFSNSRIVTLNYSLDELSTLSHIGLYISCDDLKEAENDFLKVLENDNIKYENISKDYNYMFLEETNNENMKELTLLILYVSIIYILFLIISFSKKKKIVLVKKMNGISSFRIVVKEVLPMLIKHTIIFNFLFYFSQYLFSGYQLFIEYELLKQMFKISVFLIMFFVLLMIIIYMFVKFMISMKSLKTSTTSYKNIIFVLIIKVLVLVMISLPVLEFIDDGYSTYVRYNYINENYEELSDLCFFSLNESNEEEESRAFQYYNDRNGIYCDFFSYATNTREFLKETWGDIIDEENLYEQAIDFPVIYVNANYIEAMGQKIYTKEGKELNLHEYKQDVLLVPSKYKNERLENATRWVATLQYEKEIIEIQDTGTFYNYDVEEPYTLTNPVIYLYTKKCANIYLDHFFIPTLNGDVSHISNTIFELVGEYPNIDTFKTRFDIEYKTIKEFFIKSLITLSLYLIIYISIIYMSVFWFIEEFKKVLMIKYISGVSKSQRYTVMFKLNSIIYIVPLLICVFILNESFSSLFELYIYSIIFEFIIMFIFINKMEKKNVNVILKGENSL